MFFHCVWLKAPILLKSSNGRLWRPRAEQMYGTHARPLISDLVMVIPRSTTWRAWFFCCKWVGQLAKCGKNFFFQISASEFLSFTLSGKETFCFLLLPNVLLPEDIQSLQVFCWVPLQHFQSFFVVVDNLNTNEKRLRLQKLPCSLMPTLDFKVRPKNWYFFTSRLSSSQTTSWFYGFTSDLLPIASLITGVKRKASQHRRVRN